MSALELIAKLRDKGIRIAVQDGALELDAPKGALDASLRAEIVANKADLVRLLSWSRRSTRATEVPLEPVSRDQQLPLSWAQQRLWFLDQLEPGSPAYNISWTVRLKGTVDMSALQAAFDALVARHEALRTVFPADDGEPYQQILSGVQADVRSADLSAASDEQLRARMAKLAGTGFDLARGPLLRAHLLRLNEAEYILLVVVHHIVADGASMRILFRELAAFYESRLAGESAGLPELPVQYADYAVWQRSWLDSVELEQQSGYWQRQLEGLPPLLELPTDRPRAAAMRYRGASVLRLLPAGLAADLRRISREHGVTLFMTMLAAFFVLLMRYTGRDDLVVGTPMGGRSRTSLEALIGFFINTVVLRADLAGDPGFATLLERVRETALQAHANQDLPFEKLVEVIQPERELSYSPVFQVMFDLQEEPRWKLPVRSLEVIPEVVFSSRTSSFDLTLSIRQAEQGLDAMFEYDTDLFDETTIEVMAAHYQTLLEGIVQDPALPVSRLPLLDRETERRQVHEWNSVSVPYAHDATVTEVFERVVAAGPDADALVDRQEALTYAELNARANRIARRLRREGIGPDMPVALCARRSAASIAAILAVHKAGGCVVPLDPAYPATRLAMMLEDCGAAWLLHEATDAVLAAQLTQEGACRELSLEEALAGEADARNPSPAAGSRNLAYLMYTSGTSGRPKGVELEHRGFVNYIGRLAEKTGLRPNDRVLQFASPSFDIAIEESLAALLNGATLVLRETSMTASLAEFVAGCERHRISWLSLPTAWWHELSEGLHRREIDWPRSLRTVVIGGERADAEAFRKWKAAVQGVRLFNTYGPTEASIVASWAELTHLTPAQGEELPIGYPVPNVRVWVMDEHLQPVPPGLPGELCIGGDGLARGYRNQPALTAERFVEVTLPDGARERLYRTGDRARYVSDRGLVFLGRNDAQLKLRGHRIEPAEIEAALAGLPGTGRTAVVMLGSGATARLVAYVTGDVDGQRLRAQLREQLPDYLVPSAVVVLDVFPFTENGKLDRSALPAPLPEQSASSVATAPGTPTERKLAEIWTDLLGATVQDVHANFFALGGHSLIATRVMARVRDEFATAVPLRALFDNPTIAGLAGQIDMHAGDDAGLPLIQAQRRTELMPLSWAQQRLWMLDRLEQTASAYNLYSIMEVDGALDIGALQTAVDTLVGRHEVLRTVFVEHAGEPLQLVQPATDTGIRTGKLDEPCTGDLTAQLQPLVDERFDLQRGPLLRVHLLDAGTGEAGRARQLLVLVMHHIVTDGWSMQVLFRELREGYAAALQGRAPELPALPVQYADYAGWQRELVAAGRLAADEAWWREALQELPPLLPLPADYPRPAVQTYAGAWEVRLIDPALLGKLRAAAERDNATLYMVLLTAFKALLYRYTGVTDLAVGTPVAGRVRTSLEPLIGCFLNTLVLRTRCRGNPTFDELLAGVRQTTLDAYDRQTVPFERLLEILQPPRSAAYTPLVQVLFNLHTERENNLQLPGVTLTARQLDRAAAKFDLSVALAETDAGLQAGFEYNTDLFAPQTMAAMLDDFVTLLRALVADPSQAIAAVPLTAACAASVPPMFDSAGRGFDPAAYASVTARFMAVVAAQPQAPAIVCADMTWSYAELAARAAAVAAQLRDAAGAEPHIGLLFGQDANAVAAVLGTLAAGRAYVPLDRHAPPARVQTVIAEAGITLVLTDAAHAEVTRELVGATAAVRVMPATPAASGKRADPAAGRPSARDDLAYVLFTSGSTGTPKGVMQTHANVLHHAAVYAGSVEMTAADQVSLLPAWGFDAAVMDIFAALLTGACLRPLDVTAGHDAAWWREQLGQLTVLHATPTVWRFLMQEWAVAKPGDASVRRLPRVRAVVLGGEEARPGDFDLFRRYCNEGAVFVNGLGPSESTTALQFRAYHSSRLPGRAVPVGLPVAGCEATLLDAEGNPAGVTGELVLHGAHVSPGYLNQPQQTAARMQVTADGRIRYRTGDRVRRLPDGRLVYAGRLDGQFKIRGLRAEAGDIEAAVLACNGVDRCAVIHERDTLTVCYSGVASPAGLRRDLQALLPAALVPAQCIAVGEWPLKPNGKVDRDALLRSAAVAPEIAVTEPSGELEYRLLGIWQTVLERTDFGVNDDFFALGGHSLLATRLLARVREQCGVRLTLRDVFAASTVAELAGRMTAAATNADAAQGESVLQPRPAGDQLPPLSWGQQRLWFLDRLEPGNTAYNLHWAAQLDGIPDATALRSALRALLARHESLRTAFDDHGGEPVQIIHAATEPQLVQEDYSGAGAAQIRARLLELVRQSFDLRTPPLLRVHVLRTGEQSAVLLIVMHHIVTDGWSMGVLFEELGELYRAALAGDAPALPELPVQYADFAVWQQRWLSGDELQHQARYWRNQLADAPPLLELPLDRPRPPVQRFRGAWVNRRFDKAVLDSARRLANGASATLFMVMVAVFNVLLMRHSGRTDIVVGTPVAGRRHSDVERLIGFFLNNLVLRNRIDPDAGFMDVLRSVRQVTLDAYDHQDIPFEKLLEILQPPRSTAHAPLIQATINLHNEPGSALLLGDLRAAVMPLDRGTSKYDLALSLIEGRQGLQAGFEYNTDVFDKATVVQLLDHFGELLQAFVAEPTLPVSAVPLSAAGHAPLAELRPAPLPHDGDTLAARFAAVAATHACRPAVITADVSLTYGELDTQANTLAARLHGLVPRLPDVEQPRTGILLGHEAETLVAVLAVLKAGHAYVPLDPQAPPARLQAIVSEAGIAAVVTSREHAGALAEAGDTSLSLLLVDERSSDMSPPTVAVTPDDLAYVLFTSGSTGVPKGVMQTHRNVLHHAGTYVNALRITADDRLTLFSAFGFDAAVMDIYAAWLTGAALYPLSLRDEAYPGQVLDRMSEGGVTVLHATPTVFRFLMRSKVCRHELDTVRAVVLGGEEAQAADFDLFRKQFARPAIFVNGLGPSESTLAAQFFADHDTRLPGGIVPVGRAVADTELVLLDAAGRPTGLVGELAIRSPYVALGYLGQPELTRERFLQEPGSAHVTYRTGDLVRRLPDGQLAFLGRIDGQVKLRGVRIELAEIEGALVEVAGVTAAAVILRDDDYTGSEQLVAYYSGEAETADVRNALKSTLPDAMLPAAFVRVNELPLTANGKLDRQRLPVPERERNLTADFVAPRTPAEQQLAAIWEAVLGVPAVSVHDDFFELGGHSLMAAQLAARVHESMRVVLPLRRLFDTPTVAQLAEHIETLQWALRAAEDDTD